jgi:multiple sugar transport system substrate-binding protein
VSQVAFVWTADLGRNGLLTELTPLLEESPVGQGVDDFLGTDLGTVDGKIYGVPWTVDTMVLAYRPDLFEAGGVTDFPATWPELQETAQKLTLDKDGDGRTDQYGFCFPAGSGPDGAIWFIVNAYLWGNGKTFIQEDGSGGWEIGVTPEDMAEVMTYFQWFFDQGVTPESLIAVSWEGDPEMVGSIARGDCAMTTIRLTTYRLAAEQSEQPIVMALMPEGEERRVSHLGGRALALNPNTEHPEEAWEFLKYLASAETFKTYNQFPAQKSLLAEIQPTLPEEEQAYAEQLTYGITFRDYIFSKTTVSSMWETTAREFGAVFSGQKTIEQASNDLVANMETLLAEGQSK